MDDVTKVYCGCHNDVFIINKVNKVKISVCFRYHGILRL